MRKHIWTVLLVMLVTANAVVWGLDPADVYAQSIGGGNGISGQGGSGFGIAGTGLTSAGPNTVSLISPVAVANGGRGCGAPVLFSALPGSPTEGMTCVVTDPLPSCTSGTAVTSGSGSATTSCMVTRIGSTWMPGGGAASAGGPPSGSATGDLGSSYPAPTVVQVEGAAIPASANLVGTNSSKQLTAPLNLSLAETTAPSGVASSDLLYPDSAAHRWKMNNNNGTAAQVVASGADINTSDQVTITHLAAALPVAQGGTATTSTLAGIVRGGNPMTAGELNGDVTSTTANATTVVKVNGGSIPTSATAVATNSSNQIIAATVQGNGAKVQLSTGTATSGDCVKYDANGNTVDAGAVCNTGGTSAGSANAPQFANGSGGFTAGTRAGNTTLVMTGTGTFPTGDCAKFDASGNIVDATVACGGGASNLANAASGVAFPIDTTGTTNTVSQANTAGWLDIAAFGGSYSTQSATGTANGTTTINMGTNDLLVGQGAEVIHGGPACNFGTVASPVTCTAPTAPTVELGQCDQINQASSYTVPGGVWQEDIGVFYTRNMEPLENVSSGSATTYTVSAGVYSWNSPDNFVPLTVCYALKVANYPASTGVSHSIVVKVAALDANGGMSPASSATTVSAVALAFPTEKFPVLIKEGTPVTGAAGYAFWETIDGGTQFLAKVVWANIDPAAVVGFEPRRTIDWGSTVTGAGTGFVEWGTPIAVDEEIPTTAPASALNDVLLTTVTTAGTTGFQVATALGAASGTVTVQHTNDQAMYALLAYCALLPNGACQMQLTGRTLRLYGSLMSDAGLRSVTIRGQDHYGSNVLFTGWGGSGYCERANNSTLVGTITSGATSLVVFDATQFPTAVPFFISIDNEELLVTAISGGTTYTVVRGMQGTTAAAHTNTHTVYYSTGQWQIHGPLLKTQDFGVESTSSAAECIALDWSTANFGTFETNVYWQGPPASYMDRGIILGDGGGSIAGIFQRFEEGVDLMNAENGIFIGGQFTASYQTWPGLFLKSEFGYAGGGAFHTYDTFVFESPWNSIRPDGDESPAGGGYVQGWHLLNTYLSDVQNQDSTGLFANQSIGNTIAAVAVTGGCIFSSPTVTCTVAANGNTFAQNQTIETYSSTTAGNNVPAYGTFPVTAVTASTFSFTDAAGGACSGTCGGMTAQHAATIVGTEFTLNGGPMAVDTTSVNPNQPTVGCFWVQDYNQGNKVIHNATGSCGEFGIIADDFVDAKNNQFFSIATGNVGIAFSKVGSIVSNNTITGVVGSTGNVGYQIGFAANNNTQSCFSSDPYILDWSESTSYLLNIATALNICTSSVVRANGTYLPAPLASYYTCGASNDGARIRVSNCTALPGLGGTCTVGGTTHATLSCNGTNYLGTGF